MITGITLENFKCFRKVEIHPKRVTCFVGPNGTGKSSVLQAFGMLKQTVERPNRGNYWSGFAVQGPLVNLASVEALLTNFGQDDPVFGFNGSHKEMQGAASHFSYRRQFSESDSVQLETDPPDGKEVLKAINHLRVVPTIRGLVRPVYSLGPVKVNDVSLQDGLSQQEAQTATNLGYSQSEIEKISGMLKRVTGVGLKSEIVPPQSVEIKSLTPTGPVNIVSEGFGANSLIMLLLQLLSADQGATVMIEEPEIHLHPKAQAEIASVLAEVALEEDKQVIMTTHSEHITGRLLTLVAEGVLTPDDVAIYAFEKDEKGACTAKDLRINPDGTMEGALNDFFEVNLAEMNRFAQAQFSRLRSEE